MKYALAAYVTLIAGVMWYVVETHEPKEIINQEINYELRTTLHSPRPSVVWGGTDIFRWSHLASVVRTLRR